MKRCADCQKTKPPEDFAKQAKSLDGRYPYCKECASRRHRAAYEQRGRHSWLHEKTCSWCKKLKSRDAFRAKSGGGYVSRCRECESSIAEHEARGLKRCNICRKWLPTDSFYSSQLAKAHTGCRACTRKWHGAEKQRSARRATALMKEYGIMIEQYDELVARQGGKCPICLVLFEPGDRSHHVDHVHNGRFKGRIRAIVHSECNRSVLRDHEDSAILRRAADLIDNPLTDWMVPGLPSSEIRKQARKQRNLK